MTIPQERGSSPTDSYSRGELPGPPRSTNRICTSPARTIAAPHVDRQVLADVPGQRPFDALQFLDGATDTNGRRILRSEPTADVRVKRPTNSDAIRVGHGDRIDHKRQRRAES